MGERNRARRGKEVTQEVQEEPGRPVGVPGEPGVRAGVTDEKESQE